MEAIHMISLSRKLSNAYADAVAPVCRQYGVNRTEFDILLFCANNPAYNTARDVCEVRGIRRGMASVAIERLVSGGLLRRAADPDDRRKIRLVPTEKAMPLIADGRAAQHHFAEALRGGISDEEFAAAFSLAERVEQNLAARQGGQGRRRPVDNSRDKNGEVTV